MRNIILIFMIALSCAACADKTSPSQDEWGGVRADTFSSMVDGKAVLSRISPSFVNCGVEWRPGDELPMDLNLLVSKVRLEVVNKFGHDWTYEHLALDSYGKNKNMWVLQFFFQSSKRGTVVMICNLKGEIWPFGKVYDEFEND